MRLISADRNCIQGTNIALEQFKRDMATLIINQRLGNGIAGLDVPPCPQQLITTFTIMYAQCYRTSIIGQTVEVPSCVSSTGCSKKYSICRKTDGNLELNLIEAVSTTLYCPELPNWVIPDIPDYEYLSPCMPYCN